MANTAAKKYMTDENGDRFYPIGHVGAIYDDNGNTLSALMDDGWGAKWYSGTAMSGTSTTTGYYSYSACPQVKVGDYYLNTSYGYVYHCTTAGSGQAAKWTYKGCIKGSTGDTGDTGNGISSIEIRYATSTSNTTAPSSWYTSVQSAAAGSYLWTRIRLYYTNGNYSDPYYTVARQGANGSNATVTVDSSLSSTSTNPVQNKAIYNAINGINTNDWFFDCGGQPYYLDLDEVCSGIKSRQRTATIVVGAQASLDFVYNGVADSGVDYVCTGTNDQNIINSAINALANATDSGGKIILLEGTYNLSGAITVNTPNVTIEGMGMGNTILNIGGNGYNAINASAEGFQIRNLDIKKSTSYTRANYGISYTANHRKGVIENVYIYNFNYGINYGYQSSGTETGIVIKGCYIDSCVRGVHLGGCNAVVSDCHIDSCTGYGVYIDDGTYNIVNSNYIQVISSATAAIYDYLGYNVVANNLMDGKGLTGATSSGVHVNNYQI